MSLRRNRIMTIGLLTAIALGVVGLREVSVRASVPLTPMLSTGPLCADAPTYTNAPDVLPPGGFHAGLAVGDFNEDGNQDMLFSNITTASVSLRLGDGTGGFSGSGNFSAWNLPRRIVARDFDHDGDLDYAVTDNTEGFVNVRLGDGNGGFDGGTNYSMTRVSAFITSADFNGDGNLDLATTTSADNTPASDAVAIRFGDGSGGFGPLTLLAVEPSMAGIAAGDFNGDNFPDLAMAAAGSSKVVIRLSDGSGGFISAPDVPVGAKPIEVGLGDFDEDGILDFAVTNYDSNTVSVRKGDGSGGFLPLAELSAGNKPYPLVVADLNNDGKDDIIQAEHIGFPSVGTKIGIFLGDGAGGFTTLPEIPTDHATEVIAVGDFNNDGLKDIASGNVFSPNRIQVRLGGCTLADTVAPTTNAASSPLPNGAGWNNADVEVTLSATDDAGGSGVKNITYSSGGAQPTASTVVNGSIANLLISAEGETAITYFAEDNAGNVEAPQTLVVKIDKTPPTISVIVPTNGSYIFNQSVLANYMCSDAVSLVASCVGTVANGGSLDTGSVGAKTFTVSSTDIAGNAAATTVVNYTVNFGVSAMFDQTKAHKSGSTIPIKIQLVDANGANVSSAATIVHAISVIQTSSQASTNLDDAGNSNPDFDFRYDESLGGYIFNLKTTGYGTGTYLLNFVAGNSSTVHSVGFQIRQ